MAEMNTVNVEEMQMTLTGGFYLKAGVEGRLSLKDSFQNRTRIINHIKTGFPILGKCSNIRFVVLF